MNHNVFYAVACILAFCIQIGNCLEHECIFCNQNLINDEKVFESEYFVVIVDCDQSKEGHLLILPKRHIVRMDQMTRKELSEVGQVAKKIADFFIDHLETEQYLFIQRNGVEAGQTVSHVHFHMIPMKSKHGSLGCASHPKIGRLVADYREAFKRCNEPFLPPAQKRTP